MSKEERKTHLKQVPKLMSASAVSAKAFLDFKKSMEESPGEIPPKYRELISVAVAIAAQCTYCIEIHTDSWPSTPFMKGVDYETFTISNFH